jgi:transcriptional regulator with XRE-family HTH domain
MTTLVSRFGAAVRELREAQGWSQEKLAEHADLNRSYLGEIERGDAVPSLATIAKLAAALGLHLSALLARCEHVPDVRDAHDASSQPA